MFYGYIHLPYPVDPERDSTSGLTGNSCEGVRAYRWISSNDGYLRMISWITYCLVYQVYQVYDIPVFHIVPEPHFAASGTTTSLSAYHLPPYHHTSYMHPVYPRITCMNRVIPSPHTPGGHDAVDCTYAKSRAAVRPAVKCREALHLLPLITLITALGQRLSRPTNKTGRHCDRPHYVLVISDNEARPQYLQ